MRLPTPTPTRTAYSGQQSSVLTRHCWIDNYTTCLRNNYSDIDEGIPSTLPCIPFHPSVLDPSTVSGVTGLQQLYCTLLPMGGCRFLSRKRKKEHDKRIKNKPDKIREMGEGRRIFLVRCWFGSLVHLDQDPAWPASGMTLLPPIGELKDQLSSILVDMQVDPRFHSLELVGPVSLESAAKISDRIATSNPPTPISLGFTGSSLVCSDEKEVC